MDDELKTLYRLLSKDAHPDLYPASERDLRTLVMQQINDAYRRGDLTTLRMFRERVTPPAEQPKNPKSLPALKPDRKPLTQPENTNKEVTYRTYTHTFILNGVTTKLEFTNLNAHRLLRLNDAELAATAEFMNYHINIGNDQAKVGLSFPYSRAIKSFRYSLYSIANNIKNFNIPPLD